MTQEPRQDNKDARADSPLHKAWASLTKTLGMPLIVALAVIVGMIIVLLAVGLIWYLMPIFGFKNGLTITERKDLVQGLASVVQARSSRSRGPYWDGRSHWSLVHVAEP